MTLDQIIHIIADSAASTGLATLAVMFYLYSKEVHELTDALNKQYAALCHQTSRLTDAIVELMTVIIAEAPRESRIKYAAALKQSLREDGDAKS